MSECVCVCDGCSRVQVCQVMDQAMECDVFQIPFHSIPFQSILLGVFNLFTLQQYSVPILHCIISHHITLYHVTQCISRALTLQIKSD